MTAALVVCWIDHDYDRDLASNRHGRYAAYLVDHAELFDPWKEAGPGGVTRDPVEFAIAAFRVATGPIMSPGFLRWHPRVCDYAASRSDHDGRLVMSVTLAAPAPLRLPGWWWRGWERDFYDRYLEPEDRGPVALGRLELRWPVADDQLPLPGPPRRAAIPNSADATRAVAVLASQINATVGPVLAALEVGR
jgi:hypothetical protein